eukprot:CAMPEP_0203668504 /NCGR_PEP_ID=MMETSP0090-20130426/5120_1 /ASSEMBLY_ACC=CAM_ASM_001088 /TAXON_ID=426623 /ORGANISM="Chaetoceros affinis, Strain CCMP159" /LENGTH=541 /DNA_ID=CAMNT_0050532961 /DNA_START=155 /DNA_END=1780 /DNA_ORIENTATION=+
MTDSNNPSGSGGSTNTSTSNCGKDPSSAFYFGGSSSSASINNSKSFQFTPSFHPPPAVAVTGASVSASATTSIGTQNQQQPFHQVQQGQSQGYDHDGNGSKQEEATSPYISVDGRRKRRRTTLDDAFRHLSIMEQQRQQQQQMLHIDPYTNHKTSTAVSPCVSQKLNYDGAGIATTATAYDPASFATPSRRKGSRNSNIKNSNNNNDRIHVDFDHNHDADSDDEDMDGIVLRSNLDYNHETSFCSLASSIDDNIEENHQRGSDVVLNIDDGHYGHNFDVDDDDISTNSNQGASTDTSHTSNSSPSQALLFAPRKDKNKHKTIIYNQHNNPVDDRIEELIRHSRLKAMIQMTREMEESGGGSRGSRDSLRKEQKRRNYDKMLLGQNEIVKGMDNGSHTLRRKSSNSSGFDSTGTLDDSTTSTSSSSSVRRHRICRNRRSQHRRNAPTTGSSSCSTSPLNMNAASTEKKTIQSLNGPRTLLRKGISTDDNAISIGQPRGRGRVRTGNTTAKTSGYQRSRSLPREMKYPESRPEKNISNDIEMS